MADSKKVLEIIRAIGLKMEAEKEYLTELDQPIGDSDHGVNMARGFAAVEGKLPDLEGKDIGTILKTVGMTLVSTVGGASGPLYGSAYMKAGMALAVSGKVTFDYGFKRMTNPFLEVLGEGQAVTGSVVPVHPATEKLSAAWVRRIVANGLQLVRGAYDPLPLGLRLRYRLMSRDAALQAIHFPQARPEADEARRRLVYEELLYLELFLMQENTARLAGCQPVAHTVDGPRVQAFAAGLPFALTGEQERARDDILKVMAAPSAANHMLLGDVGTGKTVVAGFALAAAADTGGQALLLAPTEVLAEQHYHGLGDLLEVAGVSCALLTGSTPASERAAMTALFAAGELDVLIGTHALLSDDVQPARLTLAVIDEQQRFGVDQRAKLLAKGQAPDALYLTATPIPRTLGLLMFGDLDISVLDELPPGRTPVKTYAITGKKRADMYGFVRRQLAAGRQAYIVCPVIDEGENDMQAVTTYYTDVAQPLLEHYRVGLMHGRLKAAEKAAVMDAFKAGALDVLVSTTVIEVGVDVPNANIIVIENAERYGLSALHQLRGRVGRGKGEAYCVLISDHATDAVKKRLSFLCHTNDGFEIAKFDLETRGPGDFFGSRQHGLPTLRIADLMADSRALYAAQKEALALVGADPALRSPGNAGLRRLAEELFSGDTALN